MILKKPYAFLIKHFRLIHLIIAIPIIYLTYKTMHIVNFFSDYVANNYSLSINGNFSDLFINPFMYLGIIVVVLAAIAIYFLFKNKEKPNKNYVAIIIYYLFLFVLLNVCYNILNVMEVETIEASLARTYRDVSLLLSLPQYYFSIFVILRSLGFNVKKLNFADDLKELEISERDSEEFEFIVGVEGYKAKRKFRRFIREFTYYLKENTFIVIAIVLLSIIGIGTSFYLNNEKYEFDYKIGDQFGYKNFTIAIEDSIITNLAYNGKVISNNKYYLVLKTNITNNLDQSTLLDYSDFRILVNNEYLYPIIDKAYYFADYAIPYDGKKIQGNNQDSYVLVYEIDKDNLKEKYNLKIYNGVITKDGVIHTRYSNISLNPIVIDQTSLVRTVNLKEKLDLTNSNIGNTILTVNNYSVTNKYIYKYEKCYDNFCNEYTDYIAVDYYASGKGSTLLAMDYELVLDTTSSYSHYIKGEKTFFDNFVSISYKIEDKEYTAKVKNLTPNNLKNKLILQVPDKVVNASEIKLLITIRNKIYEIKLK